MNSSTNQPQQPPSTWDEASCIAALAKIEELQANIDELRLAIPGILHPLQIPQPSRTALYESASHAVLKSVRDLKNFREVWLSQETQDIIRRHQESYNANTDLSFSGKKVPPYGWIDRLAEEQLKASQNVVKTPEQTNDLDESTIPTIIESFRENNPHMNIDVEDDNKVIKISFKKVTIPVKFKVTVKKEASGNTKLETECIPKKGHDRLCSAVSRCIAARAQTNDLGYLLDMIAACKDLRQLPCVRCSQLIDSSGLSPAARRSRNVQKDDGSTETVWDAIHEGCL